ncbi:unnamed protein product [Lactuca virosa]|uniref:TATA box-binding protein-associated factor RNA polymerase I subunit B n=1 Tax=Lactuca virosa TaxID=75947 RepID=A0AAU9LYZ8_9ASTR|nr:unnamed protein product [Lactuca virosa]
MLLTKENVGGIVQRRVAVVKPEPLSQSQPPSQFWETLRTQENDDDDGVGPTEPIDFGRGPRTLSYEDYYSEIRMRFVASTKLFSDDWADEVINESESQVQGETEAVAPNAKHKSEPHNILGKRSVMIWYRSVSKTIPLPYSLAISFLLCHLAREPILSTDIAKWTLEGKLPYFTAFLEIEKQIGSPTNACPLSSSRMFRPLHCISIQKLESLAASIAHSIGLELPPVNFYGIAARYLGQLSLPVETILPHASRIYEWSMPPELWLSGNEFRLPTRACVLSILIFSIRILYKIHGFGKWEKGLAKRKDGKESKIFDKTAESECKMPSLSNNLVFESYDKRLPKQSNLDATEILVLLESKYSQLIDTSVDGRDLETYLEYCKNVVFAGVELSFEDHEEDQIIEDLWNYYHKEEEDHKPSSPSSNCGSHKRPLDFSKTNTNMNKVKKPKDDNDAQISKETQKEKAIRRIISNMEEKRFCYIPPRTNIKRPDDYLHYTRKKDDGNYTYASHADYYILLRSCARVGRLDVRVMHGAVLSFERRLAWLEKNIDQCVKEMPSFQVSCELCQQDDMNGLASYSRNIFVPALNRPKPLTISLTPPLPGVQTHLPFFAGDLRNPLNSKELVCGRAFFSHSALNKPKHPQTHSDLCNSTAGDLNTPNLAQETLIHLSSPRNYQDHLCGFREDENQNLCNSRMRTGNN